MPLDSTLSSPEPVLVVDLFPEILGELIELLRGLNQADWQRPTVCGDWTVKDVALHLLGGEVGNLSWRRDGHGWTQVPGGWDELIQMLNAWNQNWVETTRRMSTRVLVDLLALTGAQMHAYFQTLDLYALGGPVNWAGPGPAPVWLDVAREYTERWHHQQHIRDAVGKPGLTGARYLAPALAAFCHALPQVYAGVSAPAGTIVSLTLVGAGGGRWSVRREAGAWHFYAGAPEQPDAEAVIAAEAAWRLFTRGLDDSTAREKVTVHGDQALGWRVLDMVSIIA